MEIPYREWDRDYARGLLGDDVVGAVREVIDAQECFYVSSSASLVLGLTTTNGERVALKVVPLERRTLEQVEAVVDVQRALHAGGFPAPRPLIEPRVLGRGVATLEAWVDGEQRDLHDAWLRRHSAQVLADLVDRAPRREELPGAIATLGTGVYPPPHNPRFDFSHPEGAWIDAIAAGAKEGLDRHRDVTGHADWSTKNMSWRGDEIAAIYDWSDSCVLDAEATIVGQASVFFPATWDEPFEPKHASLAEMEAFVHEYEEAARRRLDPEAVRAAQLYCAAYNARCELSPDGEGAYCRLLRELNAATA